MYHFPVRLDACCDGPFPAGAAVGSRAGRGAPDRR